MKKNGEIIDFEIDDNDFTQTKSNDDFFVENGHKEQNYTFHRGKIQKQLILRKKKVQDQGLNSKWTIDHKQNKSKRERKIVLTLKIIV